MRYVIIGLGIYGSNLARDLTALGHEVIGADSNPAIVEAIKNEIATVYVVDSTDEASLSVLPLNNADLVIVAIGENFGASVKTVGLLKKLNVKHIYARAIDPLHYSILQCFDLERILTPEQRAAGDLALELLLGSHVVTMEVDEQTLIAKFTAPEYFVGMPYASLHLDNQHVRLITACRVERSQCLLRVDVCKERVLDFTSKSRLIVEQGDIFVCMATRRALNALIHHIS